MRYQFPGPIRPFPRMEGVLLFVGLALVIVGKFYGVPWPDALVGDTFLGVGAAFYLARLRWNKKPISDHAFSVLQSESRWPMVAQAWETVCGSHRRPTWGEMNRIWRHIRYQIAR
ncbi:MAG: hypothetical protein ACYCY2_00485 [Acidithiobacillus ferriphilus]